MNHLPGMLDHRLTISTILLSCTNSGSMAACWQEQLHCHATWSQLSAQNKHTLWTPKFITGRSHPEAFFHVTVTGLTGHHDLSEWTTPTQRDFPLKTVASIWVDRLNSWLIGSYMGTTTLHTPSIPTQGLLMLYFTRKDRYHHLFQLLSLTAHLYLPQQFYFFLPASEPNI